MCGRFALHSKPEVVGLVFGVSAVIEFAPRYNIAPTTQVLIVRNGRTSLARWGLGIRRLHNVRGETVAARFRGPYRNGRCLVPASGFYEWRRSGEAKQPFYVLPAEGELFGFAGLWEGDACAIVTTDANQKLAPIHDRMPVIVAPRDYAAWLAGADGLLRPCPPESIRTHPVSNAVNRAANDSPDLIEPLG